MNIKNIIYQLEEAKEELDTTIDEIKSIPEYDYGEFVVAMTHLYHHINTAWNSRDASDKETEECSDENFNKWRQFPSDDRLFLDKSEDV